MSAARGRKNQEAAERVFETIREGYLACVAEVIAGLDQCDEAAGLEVPLLEILDMYHEWECQLECLPIAEEVVALGTGRSLFSPWRKRLARAVANSFGCWFVSRPWLWNESCSCQFWFVGLKTSARVATATYGSLARACLRIGQRERHHGKSAAAAVLIAASRAELTLTWDLGRFGPWVPTEVDDTFEEVLERLEDADMLKTEGSGAGQRSGRYHVGCIDIRSARLPGGA